MFEYPLQLGFKVVAIGTRVSVSDAAGRQIAYIRKKMFRLKEDVTVYTDDTQGRVRYRMQADRVIDLGAAYRISGPDGHPIGVLRRHGMRSIWKSAYSLADAGGFDAGLIHEENPWTKVADGLLEAIPFVDALGGLAFNPAYLIELRGETALRVRKRRSVFESSFEIEKLAEFSPADEDLMIASAIMAVLLERDRG